MQSVMKHSFSHAPTIDIPRSIFDRSCGYKSTGNASNLIPIFLDEILPGDTITINPQLFLRLNTPINPYMDNLHADIQFFSVPIRQVWDNFRHFMGEQTDINDNTDYLIPQMVSPAGGYANESLHDYLGLPTLIENYTHSALPLRCVYHIWNEWYRDQNLQSNLTFSTGDGPDLPENYVLQKRNKRHDYFTSCLPFLQKGPVTTIPLGSSAPVTTEATGTDTSLGIFKKSGTDDWVAMDTAPSGNLSTSSILGSSTGDMYADLTVAEASATVAEFRRSIAVQSLLETDARSGTRYNEIVMAHFHVDFVDATYRPEFLGGTSQNINVTPVPQQSSTDATTPQGNLAAFATSYIEGGGFTKSFTEHCYVLGFLSVRADLTYQTGLDRMWSRLTRFDFYWPQLDSIGEQAVLGKEIFCEDDSKDTNADGIPDNEDVFGYQARHDEYRYKNSHITGKFRSNDPLTLHNWHLSQDFQTRPLLNSEFIEENVPVDRIVAVPTEPDFHFDAYFQYTHARAMPRFSIPGFGNRF